MKFTAYLWPLEHPVLSQRHCLFSVSAIPIAVSYDLWGRIWEFTWQQIDPEEAFQIQHKLPFHSDPPSPCCNQDGEQSYAITHSIPWMAFLHGGTWSSWKIVLWWAEIPQISLVSWRSVALSKIWCFKSLTQWKSYCFHKTSFESTVQRLRDSWVLTSGSGSLSQG